MQILLHHFNDKFAQSRFMYSDDDNGVISFNLMDNKTNAVSNLHCNSHRSFNFIQTWIWYKIKSIFFHNRIQNVMLIYTFISIKSFFNTLRILPNNRNWPYLFWISWEIFQHAWQRIMNEVIWNFFILQVSYIIDVIMWFLVRWILICFCAQ